MKCEGCGEKLDGLYAHSMHDCLKPVKNDYDNNWLDPDPTEVMGGQAFIDAVNKILKQLFRRVNILGL